MTDLQRNVFMSQAPPLKLNNYDDLKSRFRARTIVVAFDFVNTALGVLRDIIPAVAVLRSLIYLFASVTVTVFFYVYYQGQSR